MKKLLVLIIAMGMFAFSCNNTPKEKKVETPENVQVAKPIGQAPTGHVKNVFNVDWSIYVGWNPWHYAQVSNILSKWGKKFGITINLKKMDYIPSIEAYVAEQYDACVMTNMDVMTMPVSSGINSTVLVVGDYSNGNDAIVTKDSTITSVTQLRKIWGVQNSVSDYLKSRAEDKYHMQNGTIKMVNVNENEIVNMFTFNKNIPTVVTWNPFLMDVREVKGARSLFSSSEIPGEILDLLVANTKTVEANPDFARAMVGAWYEVMAVMSGKDEKAEKAMNIMATVGGSNLIKFKNQLKTTAMYYKPQEALDFSLTNDFNESMRKVRNFCVKQGQLKNISNPDELGIELPNGVILGAKTNVKLKFDMRYTKAAADGKL